MSSRSLRWAWAVACLPLLLAGHPQAAPTAAPAASGASPSSSASSLSAYRAYANSQAELLARMTRMLARDIHEGNVEAAQNDYAATHRYLERIRPALAIHRDLAERIDAGAEAYSERERDPDFSGFHRIEHALFALKSTRGLSMYSDRLYEDTLRLQAAVAMQPMPLDVLIDGPVDLIETVSARALEGGREPYAQTDLWDIEANIDGAREMVAALRPQLELRNPLAVARISAAFATTSERLSQFRDGCGFKAFNQLTAAEKSNLKETTATLARELAQLKAVPTVD